MGSAHGDGASFWGAENVLNLDSGKGRTRYSMMQLKLVKMLNFVFCVSFFFF